MKLVLTPENALLFRDNISYRNFAESQGEGPLQGAIAEMARHYHVWILVDSMPLISREDPELITSNSLLFDDSGAIRARYEKIHMFDVNIIDDEQGIYNQSSIYQRGEHITVVDTPVGCLGMTICYDLRFPCLLQALRKQGADLSAVAAAFTRLTGEAHWEPLLKARAIENQCIILGPAQRGVHGQRRTWGHSMVIDSWGNILQENADAVSALTLNIDKAKESLVRVREQMKVVKHNRFRTSLMPSIEHKTK